MQPRPLRLPSSLALKNRVAVVYSWKPFNTRAAHAPLLARSRGTSAASRSGQQRAAARGSAEELVEDGVHHCTHRGDSSPGTSQPCASLSVSV